MRGRLERRLLDFSGGIRRADATSTGTGGKGGVTGTPGSRSQGEKTKRAEVSDALDVIYDRRTGLARRRNGHAQFQDLSGLASLLTSVMAGSGLPAGAAKQLLFSNGASIWRFDTAGGVVGAAILAGLTAGSLWHSVTAPQSGGQGPMWMMNGSEARYWTGAAGAAWTAASGTLPIGKYLAYHGNHLWVANTNLAVSDPKSSLAWSDTSDPRAWPAANVTMFDPNDGDELTGVGRIGPYLLVFKRRKMWLIYDLDTSASRQLSAAIGCISHRSIVETPHGCIFMSERGPAICDGASIKLIEDKLNLMSLIDLTATQLELTRQINAESTGDDYYLNIGQGVDPPGPFGTIPDVNLSHYDVLNDAWWVHSCPMAQMVVWSGSGKNQIWAIDHNGFFTSTTRWLVKMFNYESSVKVTDEGFDRALTARLTLRDLDFETDRRKLLRSTTIEANGLILLNWTADGAAVGLANDRDLTSAIGLRRSTWPRPAGLPPAQRFGLTVYAGTVGAPLTPAINPPPFEVAVVTLHADVRAR